MHDQFKSYDDLTDVFILLIRSSDVRCQDVPAEGVSRGRFVAVGDGVSDR